MELDDDYFLESVLFPWLDDDSMETAELDYDPMEY